MSYDCSGAPGITIAVLHLVSVVVGAPGPWHGAASAVVPTVVSDAAMMTPANCARCCNLSILIIGRSLFADACRRSRRLQGRPDAHGIYGDEDCKELSIQGLIYIQSSVFIDLCFNCQVV